jgi:serine O-acetyltransferase
MATPLSTKIYEFNKISKHTLKSKHVIDWVESVREYFFPVLSNKCYGDTNYQVNNFDLKSKSLELVLISIFGNLENIDDTIGLELSQKVMSKLEGVFDILLTDLEAIYQADPAAKDKFTVLVCYPGFLAITYHRIAHIFYELGFDLIARIISEDAHRQTGIDIHAGAKIDHSFCIDHGTGIVIGETCRIGNHAKVFQGVTLGALSVSKSKADKQRHPIIEDNVVIYAGATILGGESVIGHDSIIGDNTWITSSVEPNSKIYYTNK